MYIYDIFYHKMTGSFFGMKVGYAISSAAVVYKTYPGASVCLLDGSAASKAVANFMYLHPTLHHFKIDGADVVGQLE